MWQTLLCLICDFYIFVKGCNRHFLCYVKERFSCYTFKAHSSYLRIFLFGPQSNKIPLRGQGVVQQTFSIQVVSPVQFKL
jgi:hypothetical protein